MTDNEPYDVIVIGSGNAGLSAAASAAHHLGPGARILVLEKAPREWAGGNSTFTAGAYRTVFHGLEDVLPLVSNVSEEQASRIDMNAYSEEDFMADLMRVTDGQADPELAKVLVQESRPTTHWLHQNGIRFNLSFHRQAYTIAQRQKFWGGMVLAVQQGGKGLIQQHLANISRLNITVLYNSPVTALLSTAECITGVTISPNPGPGYNVYALGGIVLAAGGFEANKSLRRQHLGPAWVKAYVRGTPYNTGDLLTTSLNLPKHLRAVSFGDWAGCHSTCWDANASPTVGDLALTNQYTKSGYPLGLMINVDGERFVDEGEDMRNYTYAKFGRAILHQPEGVAFQLWDADGAGWLRGEEYSRDVVERIEAETLEELVVKLESKGLRSPMMFLETVAEYNNAVHEFQLENERDGGKVVFDPSIKDGLSTTSSKGGLKLGPDKTNWALPIIKGPFLAVKVTCGITFTFGGLKTCPQTAGVISESTGKTIPGLYVAGEMVGGLFYKNYPGGSGLTSGAVFGRKAGLEAAKRAKAMS
ncbi:fumarate reductase flavo protein subunit [Microthyrium microscopicum]|uniref:Fumarate reductase flavo protein subunit n=1 Tax=Microthyrium microscopicum TaxID=703497 RepID=A0A6A6ULY3_9PEZI|nr:fumarate reductase flavo protein subunit [Microthyrium microscopicum]